ncbi:hypothetical protein E4U24_004262 [Claviceps purpurea]|nr:hypothetical protein E4U24_004262 [Claviceps purpurea]
MRATTQCINTSHRALCRVFLPPIEQMMLPLPLFFLPCQSVTKLHQLRSYASKPPARGPRGRTAVAASEQVAHEERGFDKRFTTQKDIDNSGRSRPPQNDEITDPLIMVIDKTEPEGPFPTRHVLAKLDPDELLRMIHPYIPADLSKDRPKPQYALCKIFSKAEELERQKQLREKKKAESAKKIKSKELELTWSISEHDLGTKMRQMGRFLAKGYKVEVLVARKKGGRQASMEEAEKLVKSLQAEVEKNDGRETKPSSGATGGTMRFFLEGKLVK